MLLCDYAEELNGKLYVMGGGWSRNFTPGQPSNMALAIKLTIPWNEANRPYDINVRLVDDNHEQVTNDEGNDIGILGKVEVGRPPGLRPGSDLGSALALTFTGLVLEPGAYVWELLIDTKVWESTTFDVVDPNPQPTM
jgi:hypothetical protein